jgi:hypothetical protein
MHPSTWPKSTLPSRPKRPSCRPMPGFLPAPRNPNLPKATPVYPSKTLTALCPDLPFTPFAAEGAEASRLEDELARAHAARTKAEAALLTAIAAKDSELSVQRTARETAEARAQALEQQVGGFFFFWGGGVMAFVCACWVAVPSPKDSLSVSLCCGLWVIRACGCTCKRPTASRVAQVSVLEAAQASLVEDREISEGQLLAALRREVEGAERQLDEERAAHAATRRAAAAREQALSAGAEGAAAALAAQQRELEARAAAVTAVEERCALLERELELTSSALEEERQRRAEGEAAAASGGALAGRVAELEAALARAAAAQVVAESGRAAADEESVRLRSEAGSLRRQLEERAAFDAGDMQRRLKELTDMLYLKQTQLERLAAGVCTFSALGCSCGSLSACVCQRCLIA